MKHNTAKIYRHPTSPYFQAWFMVWCAASQSWKPKTTSTKCTDPAKALTIARQFEKLALAAAGVTGDARLSRDFVVRVINDILTISGQPALVETRQWDEYSQEWLGLQSSRIKDRSLESYTSHIRQVTRWLEKDANVPLSALTGKTLQSWYDDMLEEGRKPATVNNAVKTLQQIFDRAKAEGFCERNPAELILRQYGQRATREPFTLSEIDSILTFLKKQPENPWLTVTLLSLYTSQRLQDCTKASGKDFSEKAGYLVWNCTQSKTNTIVEIPIIEPAASHIRSVLARVKHGPLCPDLTGIPSGGPNGLSCAFSDILDSAGIKRHRQEKIPGSKGQTWTDKTFHSLRHTTNSLLANAGIDQSLRKLITGHASDRVNDGYTHLSTTTKAEALEKALDPQKKPAP